MLAPRLTRIALVAVGLSVLAAPSAGAQAPACGTVITEDTKLQADLTNCPGDGLVIGADGITLDLNGHSITGTGGSNGANLVHGDTEDGVDNTAGHSEVTIENGRVQGFDVGVKLDEADSNHLTGLELSRNLAGALPYESNDNLIEHNRAHQNGYGLYPYESSGNTIVDNELAANTFGIYPVESSDNLIEKNSLLGNAILGMQVAVQSNRNRISSNVIDGSTSVGLLISGSDDNVADHNQVTRNTMFGLIIADTDRTLVQRNTIALGTSHPGGAAPVQGVSIGVESHDVVLRRNSVTGYATGVRLGGPQTGLVMARNEVFGNSGDGIFAGDGIVGLLDRNIARHNGDDGIEVDDARTRLVRNLAHSNGDFGIEAVPGADGGGNVAWGNGNAAQCLNVVCSR